MLSKGWAPGWLTDAPPSVLPDCAAAASSGESLDRFLNLSDAHYQYRSCNVIIDTAMGSVILTRCCGISPCKLQKFTVDMKLLQNTLGRLGTAALSSGPEDVVLKMLYEGILLL